MENPMNYDYYLVFACSLLSLVYGAITSREILKSPEGDKKMIEIARAIQEGAQAYLNRQYITILLVGIFIAVLLYNVIDAYVSIGFVLGAFLSGLAGYIRAWFENGARR